MEHEWSSSSCALHALRLLLTPLSSKFVYAVFFFFTLANEKECHGCSETKNKTKKSPRSASLDPPAGAAKSLARGQSRQQQRGRGGGAAAGTAAPSYVHGFGLLHRRQQTRKTKEPERVWLPNGAATLLPVNLRVERGMGVVPGTKTRAGRQPSPVGAHLQRRPRRRWQEKGGRNTHSQVDSGLEQEKRRRTPQGGGDKRPQSVYVGQPSAERRGRLAPS